VRHTVSRVSRSIVTRRISKRVQRRRFLRDRSLPGVLSSDRTVPNDQSRVGGGRVVAPEVLGVEGGDLDRLRSGTLFAVRGDLALEDIDCDGRER
jgi:hypothetical protein